MITSASEFLEAVYTELEYNSGNGYHRVTDPVNHINLSHIGWLDQARRLGAETIFFVEDYPTVLFFKLDTNWGTETADIEAKIHELFLKVWNTSRVPIFFVALPGELRVYSAYQKPVKEQEWLAEEHWLKRIQSLTQIVELSEFSRAQIETGQIFRKRSKDFDRENRVDQWLLKNLRLLRQRLEGNDKKRREYAHALIGRSIFIRYLEDRRVLVADYFADVNLSQDYRGYTDVLISKTDTYQLFRKLRKDFNGDLFPLHNEEKEAVEESDLHLLRDFLLGQSMDDQPYLLFWAYQFDIIPIELISNIYEEFYHEYGNRANHGTHYTPTTLVDFVLSQTLTAERLDKNARVLDAACGSGIFLVEAFKRMVYHVRSQYGGVPLSRTELVRLLTEKIVGIDINQSAIQVAAFSLYLAFLDFREPPDIRANKQLPKLIYDPADPENSGKSLFHSNAFFLTASEKFELDERISTQKRYEGKADDIRASQIPLLPLNEVSFDVIVGNPPWGTDNSDASNIAIHWCKAFRFSLGDKELSQCFIARLQRLLNSKGEIGLLVSTGVFFKHQSNSQDFRKQWLSQNQVRAIYNFSLVRQFFFLDAIAPFAGIFFTPVQAGAEILLENKITYVSVKRQALVEQLQCVIIERNDIHRVRQNDFIVTDWLWKTYIWGSSKDAELIGELKSCYPSMSSIVSDSGRGYQEGGGPKTKSTHELGVNLEIDIKAFSQNKDFSEISKKVEARQIHRLGEVNIYQGPRLLVKRGISRSGDKLGEIQARLAYTPFAFRNSIIGFRLDPLSQERQQILLAIMLSSLAKYYHFLTCSTWGFWHDEIHVEEYASLPICFPTDQKLETKILSTVKSLITQFNKTAFFDQIDSNWRIVQDALDEAIFDLYELSDAQRDLVRDLCQVTLEYFYEGTEAQAVKAPSVNWLENYQAVFLDTWQDRLAAKGKELEPVIYAPHNGLLIGMVFELVDHGKRTTRVPITDSTFWQTWFRRLSHSLLKESSSQIYIDRAVKELTASSILIIKRAERRLWTKSVARQDAQELLTEVFKLEWQQKRSSV